MKHLSRRAMLAALAIPALPGSAVAQQYPAKPIRLVVGVSPGGAVDTVARNLATRLSALLGQQVIVDNRAGAGGNLAYDHVAKSAPDGYTLAFVSTGIATYVSLYKRLPYDAVKDLTTVSLVSKSSHVLVVPPSLGIKTVQQFIALAKERSLTYGSAGNGTVLHIAGEMMNRYAGTKLIHVAYRGAAPAMQDLLGGSIQAVFSDMTLSSAQVKAGKLIALATTGAQRAKAMPDVPTIAESGVPSYEIEAWFGVMAPAGTPRPIVERLSREITLALSDADLNSRMLELGQEMGGSTPEEFSRFLRKEIQKMADVVRHSGIELQ